MPNLNATKIGTKNYVSLSTKTVREAKDILKPKTLLEMIGKVSEDTRGKLKNTKNAFSVTLNKELAIPVELLVLLNLLMVCNNSDETGFPLQLKTIAQLKLFNHKNRSRNSSTPLMVASNDTKQRKSHLLFSTLS